MSKRLLKDIQAVQDDTEWNFEVTPNESDLSQLKASFSGPTASPYEGGTFVVEFKVPNEYPLKPPVVRFDTPVFHPNVSSQTGAICLDILKNAWTPVYSIKSILISLQQLLDSPNASDPQDAEVARIYTREPENFAATAREWTKKYASKPDAPAASPADPETIAKFEQMGFPRAKTLAALQSLGIHGAADEAQQNKVLEALLSS